MFIAMTMQVLQNHGERWARKPFGVVSLFYAARLEKDQKQAEEEMMQMKVY